MKKKKVEEPKQKEYSYSKWDEDFGFYLLISDRKKNITKTYLIDLYSSQKSERDTFNDDDLDIVVKGTTLDILNQLGDNYKNFLIDKYFGTLESLIYFVNEDVYVSLFNAALEAGIEKIKNLLTNKRIQNINERNSGVSNGQ